MQAVDPLHLLIPPATTQPMVWTHLPGASLSLVLAQWMAANKNPILIVTPDSLTAMRLEYEIAFFQSQNHLPLLHFPDWETLPYDHFSPHQDIVSSRLSTLSKLPNLTHGAIITPITTLMQRLPPRQYLDANIFLLKVKDKLNIDNTRHRLQQGGYRNVPQVKEHGEFAVRGAIIDIFPMGSALPYRIDLFDDEIDSIRTFSPDTQRTLDKIDKIELLPAKEFPLTEEAIELFRQHWRSQFTGNPLNCPIYQDMSEGICPPGIEYYLPFFFEKTATVFEYMPANTTIVCVGSLHAKSEEFWAEIQARFEQRSNDITHPILNPSQLFLSTSEVFQQLRNYFRIKIETSSSSKESDSEDNFGEQGIDSKNDADHQVIKERSQKNHIVFNVSSLPNLSIDHKSQNPLTELQKFIENYSGRILFCAETAGRREVLLQLFNRISLHPKNYHSWDAFLNDKEKYGIIISALEDGMLLEYSQIAVIAESQLFGKRIMQRRRRKVTLQDPDAIIKDLTELQVGAPIVHIDHGVGRYLGLQTLTVGEQLTEFLTIEYADQAKLYVPVASLHLISRYSGLDPEQAPLHRLGTDHWQRTKRKAAEQVRDVAAELLDIYARRAAYNKDPNKQPNGQLETFAAAFPFEETPDQQQAIEQVTQDLLAEKPMDRLVCGDVGFGKTEVAMRAAFLTVQNNKQAAILVPTTLLAQQHYLNFLDRFADWPFRIEVISRFKTSKEQQKILEDLASGKVDIIIGTHKLIQEKIQFKTLGLVVIDEEHRFGVRQKEYLKSLRSSVDILALTATPIPRTLNMAFSGIRDLSIIATPPAKRLSIKTFLHEFDKSIIKEAILREILRGGQVYFLHNDVATIEKTARDIEQWVPEARVAVAHGQMRERELEQIMADFYHRRFNVLVCTTIVESGIDIPSANTIIIDRADKLGLAQLHQLRGRVGRSHHQAYAYLLIPSHKNLTPDAAKRLDAITAYEDLGIGFTLATHDLEIRGAGDLLGEGQSGNMQAIGFTLYMDLLARAVDALKSGNEPTLETTLPRSTEIDLQIPALIPENYLGDVHLRLMCYKRIASAKTSQELDEIQVEMIDRFGLLPDSAKNLFALNELRHQAEKLGIIKLEANAKGGKLEFIDKPNIDPMHLIKLIQTHAKQFKLDGSTRLRFTLESHESKQRIHLVTAILQKLNGG